MMCLIPSYYYNMDYTSILFKYWFLLIHKVSCSTIFLNLYHPSQSVQSLVVGSLVQTRAYLYHPLVICSYFCGHYVPPLIWYQLTHLETTDWIRYSFPCASRWLCASYSIPHFLLVHWSLPLLSTPFHSRLFLYWNCWNFHILFLWHPLVSFLDLFHGLLTIPRLYPPFLLLITLLHLFLVWTSRCRTS